MARASEQPARHRLALLSADKLGQLCACVPPYIKTLSDIEREMIRVRVANALADAVRIRKDYAKFGALGEIYNNLATLRRHLANVRVLLNREPGLVALLNDEANRVNDPGAEGFELVFHPDPSRGQVVGGAKLVAMTRHAMGMLEGLTKLTHEALSTVLDSDGKQTKGSARGGNKHKPANNFLISVAALILRDIAGDDPRLHKLSYNAVHDRGSPLVEFVRCVLRLAGEEASAGGDNVKQHLRALRVKQRGSNGFPVHL